MKHHNKNFQAALIIASALAIIFTGCFDSFTSSSNDQDVLILPQITWMEEGEEVEPENIDSVKITIQTSSQDKRWVETISFDDGQLDFHNLPKDTEMEMIVQGIDSYGAVIYEGSGMLGESGNDASSNISVSLQPPVAPGELNTEKTSKRGLTLKWAPQSSIIEDYEIEIKSRDISETGITGDSTLQSETTDLTELNVTISDTQQVELRVRAVNSAGYSEYSELIVVDRNEYDASGPMIFIMSHSNPDTVSTRIITLAGMIDDVNAVASVSINDSSIEVSNSFWERPGIYLTVGKNVLEIKAEDNSLNKNSTTENLTIYFDPDYVSVVNNPPQFVINTTYLTLAVKSGSQYSRVLNAIDPDEFNTLTYEVSAPLTLVDDTLLNWTPALSDTGVHEVIAVVSDQDGANDSLKWEIEVLDSRFNTAPIFVTTVKVLKKEVFLGETYTDSLIAVDLDQSSGLEFEVTRGNISVDETTGLITWTPAQDDVGSNPVTVQVKDDADEITEISWTITVSHPNVVNFKAGVDTTLSINDTLSLEPQIDLKSGSVIKYEWDIGGTNNFIEVSRPDTVIVVPGTAVDSFPCILRITLFGGDKIQDQVLVFVHQDNPRVWFRSTLQVPQGESGILVATGTDKYGEIVKWEWDIGNTGEFTEGSSQIEISMPEGVQKVVAVVRVTDDDGNQTIDSTTVSPLILLTLEGGTFTMGSVNNPDEDETVHEVTLDPFQIDVTEIDQLEYYTVMGLTTPWPGVNGYWPDKPMSGVTWFDAVLFCNARSKTLGLDTVYSYTLVEGSIGEEVTGLTDLVIDYSVKGFRLPTEAEWEYSARAETTTEFYWGDSSGDADDYATYEDNSKAKVSDVGSKLPNDFGLFDTAGNLWEWCNDWYAEISSSAQTNPRGPESGQVKVIRGGSFQDNVSELRSSNRNLGMPGWKSAIVGFRTVLPDSAK